MRETPTHVGFCDSKMASAGPPHPPPPSWSRIHTSALRHLGARSLSKTKKYRHCGETEKNLIATSPDAPAHAGLLRFLGASTSLLTSCAAVAESFEVAPRASTTCVICSMVACIAWGCSKQSMMQARMVRAEK